MSRLFQDASSLLVDSTDPSLVIPFGDLPAWILTDCLSEIFCLWAFVILLEILVMSLSQILMP